MEEKGKFCPSLETVLSEIQIKSLQLSYNTCHKNISCILIIDLIIILILYLGELANPEIDNVFFFFYWTDGLLIFPLEMISVR